MNYYQQQKLHAAQVRWRHEDRMRGYVAKPSYAVVEPKRRRKGSTPTGELAIIAASLIVAIVVVAS